MTTFLDGPAKGQALMLTRAPQLLRVVYDAGVHGGKWDALDQLDDTPRADESIYVYRMVGEPTWMHVRRDRKHGGSGVFRGGIYELSPDQPSDQQMRSVTLWREWVSKQVGHELAEDGTAKA